MDHHPSLAIWFFVFVIYGACSDVTQETLQNNPLDKPVDNNGRNQYPVRNSGHKNSAVSNEKNQSLESHKHLNSTQNSPLPKYPHSSGGHKVIKRQDDPPPSQLDIDTQRNLLATAVEEAIRNEETLIQQLSVQHQEWQAAMDYREQERRDDDRFIYEREEEVLRSGGSVGVVNSARDRRRTWWATWRTERNRSEAEWDNELNLQTEHLRSLSMAAQQALDNFDRWVQGLAVVHSEF